MGEEKKKGKEKRKQRDSMQGVIRNFQDYR
jgi:hypothetical protein